MRYTFSLPFEQACAQGLSVTGGEMVQNMVPQGQGFQGGNGYSVLVAAMDTPRTASRGGVWRQKVVQGGHQAIGGQTNPSVEIRNHHRSALGQGLVNHLPQMAAEG
ncbi:hypothetical protein JCM17960_06740 [Magnetospira thiophila]